VSAYFDTLKQAFKDFNKDHMTSVAAALAYYAFLAIPATLLVAVGLFSLFAGPGAINTVIDKLGNVIPKEALDLVEQSLTNMTQHRGTGLTVLLIGLLLALWSLTGAMQNVMWALNIAYDREETRSFVQKRLAALAMIGFGLLGFALAFGVLVLGPHLATWIGDATGSESVVKTIWYIAEWPLLLAGLLLSFAGVMYFGLTSNSGSGASSPSARCLRSSSGSSRRGCSRSTSRSSGATTRRGARSPGSW